jgi:hypothetical protein
MLQLFLESFRGGWRPVLRLKVPAPKQAASAQHHCSA